MAYQDKEDVVRMLLSSLRLSPPGGRWQFMWSRERRYPQTSGFSFTFFTDVEKEVAASALAIRCYETRLRGCSIHQVSALLKEYFKSVISDIGVDPLFFPEDRNRTVLEVADSSVLGTLATKLDTFVESKMQLSVYLMPVTGLPCAKTLLNDKISWLPGDCDLAGILTPYGVHPKDVENGHFPPFANFGLAYEQLTGEDSWFLCRTSSEGEAESIFKRMVGALSAILEYPASRVFTGRKMIGGRASFGSDGYLHLLPKPAIVPAVGTPIVVTEEMMRVFGSLLLDKSNESRIQISLEYLADAWANTTRLSFINTSIAMDALFGLDKRVKSSILKGVEDHASIISNAVAKYELILKIRNKVLHGEYPSIELCPHYLEFFEGYGKDPIREQTIIINACLMDLAG